MQNRSRLAVCALAALPWALNGCAPGADLALLPPPPKNVAYRLASGDLVRILTFGEPNLSGEFSVDDSGNIALPLIGILPADGRTPQEFGHEMQRVLESRQLLTHPSVAVEVATYRPIFILGEVQHPGRYPYQPGMTMLGAVAVAGGFTARAAKNEARVLRSDADRTVEGKVDRQAQIEPGDVITLMQRNF